MNTSIFVFCFDLEIMPTISHDRSTPGLEFRVELEKGSVDQRPGGEERYTGAEPEIGRMT